MRQKPVGDGMDREKWQRANAVCWFVAAACIVIMALGVELPGRGPNGYWIVTVALFLGVWVAVALDGYLGVRLWFDPPDWAPALAALLLAVTALLAAGDFAFGSVAPSFGVVTAVPLYKPVVAIGGATVAAVLTIGAGPIAPLTPQHRCPHCGAPLSWRSWRACSRCGLLLRSARYRH